MRHDRIIDAFGGTTTFADLVDRDPSAVSRWRKDGIPPNLWVLVVRLGQKLKVRVETPKGIAAVTIESLTAGFPVPPRSYRTRVRA